MQLKCIKNSRKLVKGQIYEAEYFDNTTNRPVRILIENFGWNSISYFKLPNGSELPKIKYDSRKKEYIRITDLQIGDIIVCQSDRTFRYLIKDAKYRISDIQITTDSPTWSHGKIKLEGYDRWISWSSYHFRKLSVQENRELTLSQIFDKKENFSVDFKRKFDQKEDKNIELIKAICSSVLDKNRHHLDVLDWAAQKSSSHLSITKDDFKNILNLKLSEIIDILDKK